MSPEEVIEEYFKALNNHDKNTATACLSRTYMTNYLTMNMDFNLLYNKDEKIVYNNINSIKLIKVQEAKLPYIKQGELLFNVEFQIDYDQPTVEEDGRTGRIIILAKEYKGGGWKISRMGTG
jgi:hypothetical protein